MNKYAVFQHGGKQYRVKEGDKIVLETIDSQPGDKVKFDKVLFIKENEEIVLGSPYISGATIEASVVEHGRMKKIEILKFKRRKHHMKRMGHRQNYTEVNIEQILNK